VPKTKAPRAGAGLGGSNVCVAITGLAVPSERSKPTTSTPSRTVGCTAHRVRTKKPRCGGAKSGLIEGLPSCDARQTHRDNTTVWLAQRAAQKKPRQVAGLSQP
jgi:hypothetical protein